ncbi:hypothetical protein SRABI128_05338 [Microbacterium sp. Bi128]|nr:hypothetical protein SRABI128_05338 [Microbacterium sp. Bi128]
MVDGVERGHDGQQCLRGADVGRGLLTADVLLAGLQGQAVGRDTGVVLGDADDAAGERAFHALAHRHVRGVRAAEEQRHAQALGGADGDVRPLLARRGDQGQGKQIRRHGDQCAAFFGLRDHAGLVPHPAGDARLLEDETVDVAVGQTGGEVSDLHLEAQRLRSAPDDGNGLREAVGVEDGLGPGSGLVFVGAAHEKHGLGNRGGLVQEGRIGDRERGEVLDHGLEVQQRLEASLGDFRLVRGVGGVPGGGFEDVAADHRRGDGVVVALADHLHGRLVLVGELAQFGQHLDFAEGAVQGEGLFLADGIGDRVVNEAINAVVADGLEHGVDVGLAAGADVAVCEGGRGRLNRHERNSIIQVASRRHDDSGSSPLCIGPESFRAARFSGLRLHRR